MSARGQGGFTLTEILISVAILGILLMFGIPSFTKWIADQRTRTAAEGMLNGMQSARAEAVRRNQCMQIKVSAYTAWTIATCADHETALMSRGAIDDPKIESTTLPADANTVSFTGLGRVLPKNPADDSAPITQLEFENKAYAGSRKMRVVVSTGGGVRMCDPQVTAGEPRAC
jgi:type IV fimbrial biogenesis protein FimT